MPPTTLPALRLQAAQVGFNLLGMVDAGRFDQTQPPEWRASRLQPGCGTVLVLGSGGRGFWDLMVAEHGEPQRAAPGYHPVQQFAVGKAQLLQAALTADGVGSRLIQPEDRQTLNFPQLAEMGGLGTVSPVLQILIHPVYGPWVSLRAALLMTGHPFGPIEDQSIADRFQPCCQCSRPCLTACPAGVHDGNGGTDFQRCAAHRHTGHCSDGCSARRACPVGAEHRYGPREERHRHAYSLFAMQKWFGLGRWRFVPRILRH